MSGRKHKSRTPNPLLFGTPINQRGHELPGQAAGEESGAARCPRELLAARGLMMCRELTCAHTCAQGVFIIKT